jgi:hypothetical protein
MRPLIQSLLYVDSVAFLSLFFLFFCFFCFFCFFAEHTPFIEATIAIQMLVHILNNLPSQLFEVFRSRPLGLFTLCIPKSCRSCVCVCRSIHAIISLLLFIFRILLSTVIYQYSLDSKEAYIQFCQRAHVHVIIRMQR